MEAKSSQVMPNAGDEAILANNALPPLWWTYKSPL